MQQVRAMSAEEFLRKEVFRQPTKRTVGVGKGVVPQRGADDRMDMTPDSVPKYQKIEFRTREGVIFGVMELFRNAEGQIAQRNALFGKKKNIVEYGYDEQGRLTAVRMNGFLTEQYNYGVRGERLQELNGARYVYNYSSQLEQVRTPNGNIVFAYDQQGRRIARRGAGGETSYHYNKYGLLEQVCTPDGRVIKYTYDPLGRRSFKAVNGKVTEKYCWKDMLRLQAACTGEDEDHVVFKYAQTEKNALQPTSLTCKGKEYFLAYDHVGTLLALSDETGLIAHVEETDSFGRRLSNHKLATVAMLSFGGGQLDEDTGLVHFLFRDYDPTTGLFIQKDPLGLRGGDVDVYGYCLDDPVNLIDPIGLFGLTKDERKMINGKTRGWAHTMKQLATLLASLPGRASIFADVLEEILSSKGQGDERDDSKDEAPNESYERKGEDKERRVIPEESYPKLSLL